ncbi:uroporphyrinogen-III synthase [Luteimonas aestuarii]|uniref:Uroporphyrinogen-III synthase n=1 Tax=Luteimonas aestuarii TaxID=453837 RepID=A0A4R5TP83_9GAMM|nr:uroporphyrinogen-III synthase [Luteimonas aestuarii]TDK23876.1 uroporphyrinogen-III synthase [Luteimonas aestuarii]
MVPTPTPTPLQECYVISLRPVGAHGMMRRAAAARGMRVLALSPWRIEARDDAATRKALRAALAADAVVFTSPPAVRAAAALQPLRPRRGQSWLAVGGGTAAALRRAGVQDVGAPTRMDSEGLLALPALRGIRGQRIGLVTAPGGRGALAPALGQRGATVVRANVYERVSIAPSPRAAAFLQSSHATPWLALSSGEALRHVLSALPTAAATALRRARVVAASARLADLARGLGFRDVRIAVDARPGSLVDAIAE